MNNVSSQQLLAEVEDVLRTMPPREALSPDVPEISSWLGRASAVMAMWDPIRAVSFTAYVALINTNRAREAEPAVRNMITMLHQALNELRLKTVGPLNTALGEGAVFEYFDEVRKVVETAKSDLFFIDPYLDAEFVSRYLPQVSGGVMVRLLAREYLSKLVPAVKLFREQSGLAIEVRSAQGFHDRYVFVDGHSCYQSGASFKDGAKKAPTTLTQITDAFGAVYRTYEEMWAASTAE